MNSKSSRLKEEIKDLRLKGYGYNQISRELQCAKSTISYHCKILGLDEPIRGKYLSDIDIENLREYYKTHTNEETAKHFNVSSSTVKTYSDKKMIIYTDSENKKRNYERIKSYRQETKRKAVEYLGGKCVVCGYDKCIWALDFHHRESEKKEFTISKYTNHGWNIMKLELDKCDLLCANCHRETHYRDVFPLPDKQLKG